MLKRRSDSRLHRGRKLDVALREDTRNELYRMQEAMPDVELPVSSRVWACPTILDQGREGACVGYAGAHCYGTDPGKQSITRKLAKLFYRGAQEHDAWPGNAYEGTSVNGLMDYLKKTGQCSEYRWIRDMKELQQTISHYGSVIVGCEWREGCFTPDRRGFIHFRGMVKGGHATCWRGVIVEEGYFVIQQSWGKQHGIGGSVKMSFEEADKLLKSNPQIAIPTRQKLKQDNLATAKRWWQFWKFWK